MSGDSSPHGDAGPPRVRDLELDLAASSEPSHGEDAGPARARDLEPVPAPGPGTSLAGTAGPAGTLAERLTWLMRNAHPAGRGPLTTHQAAALVEHMTGETIAHTTIWKICQGTNANPGMRVIQALARTFGVPVAFFFGELPEGRDDRAREEAELLAMIRDADVDAAELRVILGTSPGVRRAIVDLIRQAAVAEASRSWNGR